MNQTAALTVFLFLATGCTVGPNYHRPAVDTPTMYRGLTAEQAEQNEPASLSDQQWWEVFQDEQLQELISTALQQNYDVRIAATRVLQAQAILFFRLSRSTGKTMRNIMSSGQRVLRMEHLLFLMFVLVLTSFMLSPMAF